MSDREPVCFTCGHRTDTEKLGNRLPDGKPCPSCFERVLDAQAPLLPNFNFEHIEPKELEFGEEMTISVEFEEDDDGPIGA